MFNRSELEALHSRLTVRLVLKACTLWIYRVHGPSFGKVSPPRTFTSDPAASRTTILMTCLHKRRNDTSEYDVFTHTAAVGNSNELCYARAR